MRSRLIIQPSVHHHQCFERAQRLEDKRAVAGQDIAVLLPFVLVEDVHQGLIVLLVVRGRWRLCGASSVRIAPDDLRQSDWIFTSAAGARASNQARTSLQYTGLCMAVFKVFYKHASFIFARYLYCKAKPCICTGMCIPRSVVRDRARTLQ